MTRPFDTERSASGVRELLGRCRVIANPRGYVTWRGAENGKFQTKLVTTLGWDASNSP
jgi:hypothetical protein